MLRFRDITHWLYLISAFAEPDIVEKIIPSEYDLVFWKEEPLMLSPKYLAQSTIDMTMIDGRVVYEGG
jgi:hypothetical protein